MIIVGAGMAGLLAANMLRRHEPVVLEYKSFLPDSHHAVLRFRNEEVSRATGIPFKKVVVRKAMMNLDGVLVSDADLKHSNMYSQKVTGTVMERSILDLRPVERYIAPPDFISQMARSANIKFGADWLSGSVDYSTKDNPTISTIPMPFMMKHLNWATMPNFQGKVIHVISGIIVSPRVDVYQTIYYPGPEENIYRASITGNRIILEFIDDFAIAPSLLDTIEWYLEHFGITQAMIEFPTFKSQPFGKISPIDENARKHFIYHMSQDHHIYSLGRFATWRPLLLDDLVNDIRFIEGFITQRDLYSACKTNFK